jgi:precorrin-6A synthase
VRKIYVIGIGAGDPDHLTLQAAKAIGRTDVFLPPVPPGDGPDESRAELRRRLLKAYARPGRRIAEGRDPDPRGRRSQVTEALIAEHLLDGETGAFLVWGDPTLHDSTIAVLDEILARGGTTFAYEVVPGISSVSALAARHRVGLTRGDGPVQITTGRRLADDGWPDGVDDVVVMLDEQQAFTGHPEAEIHWGAYVGTANEQLAAGPVAEVAERITRDRAQARERHGWITDTYLLRRRTD